MIKVSVLIATYNEEENIVDRINNIQQLNLPDHLICEIVIADNGSTDNTVLLAKTHFNNCKKINIKVFEQGRIGKCAAIFQTSKLLDSDWVLLTDANTEFDINTLFNLIMLVKQYSDTITCVLGNFKSLNSLKKGSSSVKSSKYSLRKLIRIIENFMSVTSGGNGAVYMVKTDILKKISNCTFVRNDDFVISVAAGSYGVVKFSERAFAVEYENKGIVEEFNRKYRDAQGHVQALTWLIKNYGNNITTVYAVLYRTLIWLMPLIVLTVLLTVEYGIFIVLFIVFSLLILSPGLVARLVALYLGVLVSLFREPENTWDTRRL